MALVVQKYGGSSVAGVEKLRRVAGLIAARRRAGDEVVAVVSAMGDTTDELLALAKQVSAAPPRRELDMLLSAGERVAMALLAMALHEEGVEARSFTGSQAGILTDESHASARIVEVRPIRVREELARGRAVIVAGYQGVSRDREVTTLGRGGSDTTAVALAAALGADCEIYSDVAGVYTADPRAVPRARRLERLGYGEMQELARAGARVLNARAVEFARARGIAIRARSAFAGPEETVVAGEGAAGGIAGVAALPEAALVSLDAAALPAAGEALARHGARELSRSEVGGRAALLLVLDDVHALAALEAELRGADPGAAVASRGLGALSAVGTAASEPRVAEAVEEAVRAAGGAPLAIFGSPLRVTACCGADLLAEASRRLHERLLE
ncbi:MAG TPA: aspartate kinase [Anaeromyxobacteraceae bacterium]